MEEDLILCTICIEILKSESDPRSIATLICGHQFHLDCIGSSFNAEGIMKCPNCRTVENGQWLYSNGGQSSHSTSENPFLEALNRSLDSTLAHFRYQWCPTHGFAQLTPRTERGRPHQRGHDEQLGPVCPYLPMFLLRHHMLPPQPSLSVQFDDPEPFYRYIMGMSDGTSSTAVANGLVDTSHRPSGSTRGRVSPTPAYFPPPPRPSFLHNFHHNQQQQQQPHLRTTRSELHHVPSPRMVGEGQLPLRLTRHGDAAESLFFQHHQEAAERLHALEVTGRSPFPGM